MKELLFTATGRINRARYWTGILVIIGVAICVSILFGIIGAVFGGNQSAEPGTLPVSTGAAILYGIVALAALIFYVWSLLCISIKRCHDRDRSGWFMLVSLIPLVGLWYAIEVAFLPGTPGPNRFGPDPLGNVGAPIGYTPA